MRDIFKSSDKVNQIYKPTSKYDFPWEHLEVGQSFNVQYGEIGLSHLKSKASVKGKQLKRKFKVVNHGKDIGYEVARVELNVVNEQQQVSEVKKSKFF